MSEEMAYLHFFDNCKLTCEGTHSLHEALYSDAYTVTSTCLILFICTVEQRLSSTV